MPSVAGMVIVNWLCAHGATELRSLLSLPKYGERLDAASLTLLFLYGNLFCYVASYPVLVFHATRVLDFVDDKWPRRLSDGYLLTTLLAALAFVVTLRHEEVRYWIAFVLASAFAMVQLRRLWIIFFPRVAVEGCSGTVSYSYGYSYALARRRGKSIDTETTKGNHVDHPGKLVPADVDDEKVSTTRRIVWHKDYMDSYRHLREHGNSAFIFLLELTLAALTYCLITRSGRSAAQQLSTTGILFAIWATPAIFVHLIAQHLERRFSHFDRRLTRLVKSRHKS
jgi:hypothetical protein